MLNKLDELHVIQETLQPSVIAITESWLTREVPEEAVALSGYCTYRKDRSIGMGGGVLLYIRNSIVSNKLSFIDVEDLEIVWVSLRPKVLPRPFNLVVICLIYCPPWYSSERRKFLSNHLVSSIDCISRSHPCTAYFVLGDFNGLDCNLFNKFLRFNQIQSGFTRGQNILDKIFTNCTKYYRPSVDILPPLGRSDHNCIFLRPLSRTRLTPVGWRAVSKRHINAETIEAIECKLTAINWQSLYCLDDIQQQTDLFYSVITDILESTCPLKQYRFKNNDKPWITPHFRNLISQRNRAYRAGNVPFFNKLRNKINRLRSTLKRSFYDKQVKSLEAANPTRWWRVIKSLRGIASNRSDIVFNNMYYNDQPVESSAMVNVINDFFVSCSNTTARLQPDVLNGLRSELGAVPDRFIVSEYDVFRRLSRLKANKPSGADGIPNLVLKNLAHLFAAPVCAIINSSIRCGEVPSQWRLARVAPIPKVSPPVKVETDLRPISITSSLSKVAESFMTGFLTTIFSHS